MTTLTYIQVENSFDIKFRDVNLGRLVKLEDGYYYWFPCDFEGSCVSNWVIKDISNKLDELNKEWNEIINKLH